MKADLGNPVKDYQRNKNRKNQHVRVPFTSSRQLRVQMKGVIVA